MTSSLSEADKRPTSLRERKKAKTHAAIREHAMRLFLEQGYTATTIEQIAEAAEVSPSTLFRYFPTKEDLVFRDEFDPLVIGEFQRQPPELSPVQAFRNALRSTIGSLPDDVLQREHDRHRMVAAVPELRAAMLEEYINGIRQIAVLIAERVGRVADDPTVRALAGAIVGVLMSAALDTMESSADVGLDAFYATLDERLAVLDAGLPI